jgi:hypothetical protein
MRNLLFSLFAIGVAAVAAMTATTAMLNAPRRDVPAVMTQNMQASETPAPPAESSPATSSDASKPTPGGTADAGAKPANGPKDGAAKSDTGSDTEGDKDPYEGIAPEELPPDLQYSADSSVSFPTNI